MQIFPTHESQGRVGRDSRQALGNTTEDAGTNAVAAFFGGMLAAVQSAPVDLPQPVRGGLDTMVNAASTTAQSAASQISDAARQHARGQESMSGQPVSQEDYASMRPALQAQGLSDKDAAELAAKVESGLTYGELTRELAVRAPKATAKVEDATRGVATQLAAFFSRLGFSDQESSALTKQLSQGQGNAALSRITEKLAALPQNTSLQIPASELNALGKALQLNTKGKTGLGKILAQAGTAGSAGMTFTPAALAGVITTMGQTAQANSATRAASMQELVSEVAAKVSARAQKRGNTAEEKAERADSSAKSDRLPKHDPSGQAVNQSAKDMQAKTATGEDAKNGHSGHGHGHGKAKQALQATPSKIGVEAAAAVAEIGDAKAIKTPTVTGSEAAAGVIAGRQNVQFADAAAKTGRADAFRQVQSAVLENLGQGRQQLTLNLTPDELGGVKVLLHVKGNELSAVLQAENGEAAQALAQQLGDLRKALEDQGVTVVRLDVQLGDTGTDASSQQHAQGHNLLQEQQERARGVRLAALRSQSGERMQEMPVTSQAASTNLGRSGLDIVA